MRSFESHTAGTRIVFGAGSVHRLPEELARLSVQRAVVLSTAGQAALARRVAEQSGRRIAGHFSGAVMHTPVEVTGRALAQLDQVGADAVISIGGGSTTGLGKALAIRRPLAHLVVPTTYAGSEVTPVLGETENGRKTTRSDPKIQPDTVIYDIDLTMTLPWAVSVTSAVNAMAHAAEALYAAERTERTDESAAQSLSSLVSGLRELQAHPASHRARCDLLYGAWLAGSCLAAVSMGLHHKLCHTLGGAFNLPHAPTHTVVLPYALAYNARAAPWAMSRLASALDLQAAPAGLQELVRSLDGPSRLSDLGFAAADIPRAAQLANAAPYPNPRPVTREGIVDLLTRATAGLPVQE